MSRRSQFDGRNLGMPELGFN
eukprot:COSAG04_NODE_21757_length_368_cov_0.758364_1_plen_20_part_10